MLSDQRCVRDKTELISGKYQVTLARVKAADDIQLRHPEPCFKGGKSARASVVDHEEELFRKAHVFLCHQPVVIVEMQSQIGGKTGEAFYWA